MCHQEQGIGQQCFGTVVQIEGGDGGGGDLGREGGGVPLGQQYMYHKINNINNMLVVISIPLQQWGDKVFVLSQ